MEHIVSFSLRTLYLNFLYTDLNRESPRLFKSQSISQGIGSLDSFLKFCASYTFHFNGYSSLYDPFKIQRWFEGITLT